MPYEATKDPFRDTNLNFGTKSVAVVASDTEDFAQYPKAIVALSAGNLVVLPVKNNDGATVTFAGVSPGFVPPLRVRRVMATGTTCAMATIE